MEFSISTQYAGVVVLLIPITPIPSALRELLPTCLPVVLGLAAQSGSEGFRGNRVDWRLFCPLESWLYVRVALKLAPQCVLFIFVKSTAKPAQQ